MSRTRALGVLLALGACDSKAPDLPEPSDEATSAPARFVVARRPAAASLLEAPARTVATVPASADLTVLHRGRVHRVHAAPGDRVQVGDPVVDVVLPEVQEAAARWGALESQLQVTRSRVDELARLQADGLARGGALYEVRAQLGQLQAERDAAQAIISCYGITLSGARRLHRAGHLTLNSPVAGVVVERRARPGAVVEPNGPPLAVVAGLQPVRIEASFVHGLPEGTDLVFVEPGGRAVALESEPVAQFQDGHTGRLQVWLEPRTETRLPDGLPGRVRLELPDGAVELPSAGLTRTSSSSARVRTLRGEQVETVTVRVLLDSGTSAVVLGDVEVGDRVATQ